jgi:hypothetical protein
MAAVRPPKPAPTISTLRGSVDSAMTDPILSVCWDERTSSLYSMYLWYITVSPRGINPRLHVDARRPGLRHSAIGPHHVEVGQFDPFDPSKEASKPEIVHVGLWRKYARGGGGGVPRICEAPYQARCRAKRSESISALLLRGWCLLVYLCMTLNTVNQWLGFTCLEVSFLLIEMVTTTGTPHGARSP